MVDTAAQTGTHQHRSYANPSLPSTDPLCISLGLRFEQAVSFGRLQSGCKRAGVRLPEPPPASWRVAGWPAGAYRYLDRSQGPTEAGQWWHQWPPLRRLARCLRAAPCTSRRRSCSRAGQRRWGWLPRAAGRRWVCSWAWDAAVLVAGRVWSCAHCAAALAAVCCMRTSSVVHCVTLHKLSRKLWWVRCRRGRSCSG